jgi:phosphoribosylamine--glycine ligase
MDEFKDRGKLTLGGGSFNDKLELDRDYAIKVASSLLKIEVPESETFNDVSEAHDYLKKAKTRQVIKPMGNRRTDLTLVSKDPSNRTLLTTLESLTSQLLPCVIQEAIEGIEISTEGWFNGEEFIQPYNHTFEKKRFMESDKGCNTGCMGNIVFTTKGDKLTQLALDPLTPLLKKVNFVGPIDVNCIVNQDCAYFLEFTPRFGYDAIQAYSELIKGTLFDYLYKIASGSKLKTDVFEDSFGIAVRLSVPPWPIRKDDVNQLQGVQVLDVPEKAWNHLWLSDVMLNKEVPSLAGVDGVIGCVTARGSSLRECRRRAYRTVDNILIHGDVQFRQDIGDDVEGKISQLKEWGWLDASA